MLKFMFCTKRNYSLCTIFRLEKGKKLCYHIYNKEEIKQQRKEKSKTPRAERSKSLQTHKIKVKMILK